MLYQLTCVVLLLVALCAEARPRTGNGPCASRGMAKYNMTFDALWSQDRFPKQYPTYRPHAQWSKVIGRTHSSRYNLWTNGELSSPGVQEYAETGTSAILEQETQGLNGILDIFNTEDLDKSGVGTTSVKVLADPYHSKVSLMAHLIPSPDWFVGVDSLDLCESGDWADRIEHELPIYDAGTDRGFTFTAPNWPEIPHKVIYQITSKTPNHPANSFFYPELDELPAIAKVTFTKVETIEMDKDSDFKSRKENELGTQNDDQNAVPPQQYRPQAPASNNAGGSAASSGNKGTKQYNFAMFRTAMRPKPYTQRPEQNELEEQRRPKQTNRDPSLPHPCEVSEWQAWSSCSKTCGYGSRIRTRLILAQPMNGGAECPELREEELCGSMRSCTWSHFSTLGGRKKGRRPQRRRRVQNRQRRF